MPYSVLEQFYERMRADPSLRLHGLGEAFVPGVGDPSSRLVLLGEAPGRDEELRGAPFVGRAGRNLDALLMLAGLDRASIVITNVLKRRPQTAQGANRKPSRSEVAAYLPYLEQELELLKPRLVLCLGASAAEALLARRVVMGDEQGRIIEHKSRRVVITYHPSPFNYNVASKRSAMERVFTRLSALLRS